MLQPQTTSATPAEKTQNPDGVTCSFFSRYRDCTKGSKCQFAHDVSTMTAAAKATAMGQKAITQLVPTQQTETAKKDAQASKKTFQYKKGGCAYCWMPTTSPEWGAGHEPKTCPYSKEKGYEQGSKKEHN